MEDLSVSFLGHRLANPTVLASGILGVTKASMLARFLASPHVDVTWRRRFLVRGMAVAGFLSLLVLLSPVLAAAGHVRAAAWVLISSYGAYALALFTASAAWLAAG